MNDSTIAQLTPTKPDAEVAAEFKARLQAKLEEVAAIMNEARAAGFETAIGFGLIQGARGPVSFVQMLRLEKHF